MAIALYLAYLKKQEALIMLNQAKVCHCESMELEKGFQEKTRVAFTNSTVFLLDFYTL